MPELSRFADASATQVRVPHFASVFLTDRRYLTERGRVRVSFLAHEHNKKTLVSSGQTKFSTYGVQCALARQAIASPFSHSKHISSFTGGKFQLNFYTVTVPFQGFPPWSCFVQRLRKRAFVTQLLTMCGNLTKAVTQGVLTVWLCFLIPVSFFVVFSFCFYVRFSNEKVTCIVIMLTIWLINSI